LSQSHHSGIERNVADDFAEGLDGRNRTTVGLKVSSLLVVSNKRKCRNRTTVGLKVNTAIAAHGEPCRNRTTVGLKAGVSAIVGAIAALSQSHHSGIESTVAKRVKASQRSVAIAPQWD